MHRPLSLSPDWGFPLMNRGVPMWLLFVLSEEIYFPHHSSPNSSSSSRNFMTSKEMHGLLWMDRRIGLRQWGELTIRNLRSHFADGGYPQDFESEFRRLAHRAGPVPVLRSGRIGRENLFHIWETVTTGVPNPRVDGPGNLNFDGDYDSEVDSICVSLKTPGTPRHVGPVIDPEANVVINTEEEDEDSLTPLEIDEDRESAGANGETEVPNGRPCETFTSENPNEAITPLTK